MLNVSHRRSLVGTRLRHSAKRICPAIIGALAIALLLAPDSASATALPAAIKENMTLTAAGNPYTGGAVTIESGATMTMNPGIIVEVSSLTVSGTLKAEGTAGEPVLFSKGEKAGSWTSIVFNSGSGESVLNHVEVRYGGFVTGSPAIEITGGAGPTITNSTIRNNQHAGIAVMEGGAPEITNDAIEDNGGYGVYYTGGGHTGKVNIHSNLIEGNSSSGFYINAGSSATGTSLGSNSLVRNEGIALYYNGSDIPPDIATNTLTENKFNLIEVGGTFAQSANWENHGYSFAASELTIASGATVTLGPGITINPSKINVSGTLKAEGTAGEPVLFSKGEKAGSWTSIVFNSGSGESVLNHVEVRYGGFVTGSPAIEITGGAGPTITNSTIRNNQHAGIKVTEGGTPEITNDNFAANGSTAIQYIANKGNPGEINIHGNHVEGGTGGIAVTVESGATVNAKALSGNIVAEASGTAFSYSGPDIPGDITENTLIADTQNYISISGTVAHSSTWKKGSTIVKGSGEVTIAFGVTLNISPGVIFLPNRIIVKGTLRAEGSAKEPVLFTGASEKSAGEWSYIKFEPGSGESVLNYTEVAYGGSGSGVGMIEAKGSHPTITNSTIRKSSSYGIKVTESGSPQIEWDRFRNSTNGLSYTGTGRLSAPNNDWECASGPKPAGCGSSVTTNVEWKPAVQLPELAGHCRGKESQCGEGADPVSLATGQLDYSHQDLLLINKSEEPLEFTRVYSSGSSADTGLGPGWSQTGLASATELQSGKEVLVLRQDGRQDIFEKTESGYKAPSGVTDTLAKVEGTFQLTTLEGTVYRFDSSGRIASITDSHGLKTTYAYNAEGRLATITDPSSQTLTFSYSASNHITLVKDSTGREVKFAYTAGGELESVTDALGDVTKYAYDSQNRLTSITDPRGNVILKNVYNGEGKITEQEDGLGNLWKLEYKPSETIVTEPEGGKRKYGFDGQDRVVSETDQLGHTTTTSYDEAGERPRSRAARRRQMDFQPRRGRQPRLGKRPRRRRTQVRIQRSEQAG